MEGKEKERRKEENNLKKKNAGESIILKIKMMTGSI